MTIKNPDEGDISIGADIAAEHGGDVPHALSEYYRGGTRVPDINIPGITLNTNIPFAGRPLSLSNFYSSKKTISVTYEIIGGGGGGGAGRDDDQDRGRGTYVPPGGNSSIRFGGTTVVLAAGGQSGESFAKGRNDPSGAGESTVYGAGGSRGPNNSPGGDAVGFGAGGGGGGGDSPDLFDSSGNRGDGGRAGTRLTGIINAPTGTTLSIIIGAGQAGHKFQYTGGDGRSGYAKISFNGQVFEFTSNGSVTIS
jgi:hypothetical protein